MKLDIDRVQDEINSIKEQIIEGYFPSKIILFGSQAMGTAKAQSDIDLCVVSNTDDKRRLLTDMYVKIDCNRPLDLILYTETEWEECVKDQTSFAYLINTKGKCIYGR